MTSPSELFWKLIRVGDVRHPFNSTLMFLSSTAVHWYNFSVIVSEEEEHIQADISVLRPDSTLENIAQLRLLYTIAKIPPLRLIFMIVHIQAFKNID